MFGMTRISRVPGGRWRRISLVDTPAATEMRSFPGVAGAISSSTGPRICGLTARMTTSARRTRVTLSGVDDDAIEPLQLLEALRSDVRHEEMPDRHEPGLGEAPDEGLAHVAPAHEPDPLVSYRHGQVSRGPKIAVPTRTIVAPSSTPTSKSPLIPIDSSVNSPGSPQPRAASSSFDICR